MEKKYIIETIGIVTKKETLETIGYNELVLESHHPFPGYHGTTVPDKDKPRSVFLVTKFDYGEEKIIRIIQKVKKNQKINFDASPGYVWFINDMLPCLRLKGIEDYKQIPEIIQCFRDEGIAFQSNKNVKAYDGIIKITKYFLLEPITDCTLQDAEVPAMRYFQLPRPLDWDDFEAFTTDIKRNIEDPNFDAALATMYRKNGMVDYIRIYDSECSKEKLDLIRKKYLQRMKKMV
jgi:hypothetical protein